MRWREGNPFLDGFLKTKQEKPRDADTELLIGVSSLMFGFDGMIVSKLQTNFTALMRQKLQICLFCFKKV